MHLNQVIERFTTRVGIMGSLHKSYSVGKIKFSFFDENLVSKNRGDSVVNQKLTRCRLFVFCNQV